MACGGDTGEAHCGLELVSLPISHWGTHLKFEGDKPTCGWGERLLTAPDTLRGPDSDSELGRPHL